MTQNHLKICALFLSQTLDLFIYLLIQTQRNQMDWSIRRVGVGTGMRAIFILGGMTFSIVARNFLLIGAIFQKLRAIFSKRYVNFYYCAQRLNTVYK